MSFYVVLIIIIVALIGILVLNQRYSNSKIDTEVYARKQLIKKNKALSAENAELRSQMLSSNNDVGHHAYKNAKRELRKILDSYLENGKLKYYDIIVTSNLATKHPFFEYARSFDFIIVSDIGLINVDVKSWGEKTFYHFDVPDEHDTEISNSSFTGSIQAKHTDASPYYVGGIAGLLSGNKAKIDKVVGHYISQQYHDQFNSSRKSIYTFTETVQPNRVIYDFYDYDPYQLAANNAKALKDHIEQNFNFKVQSTGVIYFSDGTVNIIQGSEERDKYVDTVSTKSSLRRIISEAIELSKHPLNKEQVDQITAIFK